MWTDVSELHVASIVRIEDYAKQETLMKQVGRRVHVSCLRDGNLVGLLSDPENVGNIFLRNICLLSVDITIPKHRCENINSCIYRCFTKINS
jgi:hypothetical protein